jgi:hypothetical protein
MRSKTSATSDLRSFPNLGPQSSVPMSGAFDSSGGRTFSDFLGGMVRDVNAKQVDGEPGGGRRFERGKGAVTPGDAFS